MRKILLETCNIDRQAEKAARRISIALDLPLGPDTKAAALSSVGELRIQIRDLQRQNLEWRFLAENPGFDLEKQLQKEKRAINKVFEDGLPISSLYNRYDFDYFMENYHPGFIVQLCKLLGALFSDRKTELLELWEMLLDSTGYITSDIVANFGPEETDNGVY
jgi:hypothetical protein